MHNGALVTHRSLSLDKEHPLKSVIAALTFFLFSATAMAARYNFMAAEDLQSRIHANDELLIVDIQVEEEFNRHHIPGSLATYAYPVKDEAERARLDPVVSLQHSDPKPVIIVCPCGAEGAKRTFDYLVARGVSEERRWILEKGMAGWEFDELTAENK